MVQDFFNIISQCVALVSGGAFFVVLLVSLVLGALCWMLCSNYTKLWHRNFHVRLQHHLLCGIAAVLTVFFTLWFYAVGNLEFIVDEIIDQWNERLINDEEWNAQTYETAFYAVKEEYPREFTGVPEPGRQNSVIPINNDHMMQICVETYVNEACADFSTLHPFLDKILRAKPGISEDEIKSDIREFFRKNPGETYPLVRAVVIAAEYIREILLEQSPKTVRKTRWILVAFFLAAQLIPFGVITYCANEDLKKGKSKSRTVNNKRDDYY